MAKYVKNPDKGHSSVVAAGVLLVLCATLSAAGCTQGTEIGNGLKGQNDSWANSDPNTTSSPSSSPQATGDGGETPTVTPPVVGATTAANTGNNSTLNNSPTATASAEPATPSPAPVPAPPPAPVGPSPEPVAYGNARALAYNLIDTCASPFGEPLSGSFVTLSHTASDGSTAFDLYGYVDGNGAWHLFDPNINPIATVSSNAAAGAFNVTSTPNGNNAPAIPTATCAPVVQATGVSLAGQNGTYQERSTILGQGTSGAVSLGWYVQPANNNQVSLSAITLTPVGGGQTEQFNVSPQLPVGVELSSLEQNLLNLLLP